MNNKFEYACKWRHILFIIINGESIYILLNKLERDINETYVVLEGYKCLPYHITRILWIKRINFVYNYSSSSKITSCDVYSGSTHVPDHTFDVEVFTYDMSTFLWLSCVFIQRALHYYVYCILIHCWHVLTPQYYYYR